MKKLFTFLSRANNNSVGISLFNHRRVSSIYSMLTFVAIILMVPSGMKAKEISYDFKALAEAARQQNGYYGLQAITMGATYPEIGSAQYGTNTTFGSVTVDLSRFGFRNNNDGSNAGRGWQLWCQENGTGSGLMYKYTEPKFAITNLRPDDEITITFRGQSNRDASISFDSGSATQYGNSLSSGTVIANAYGGNENSTTIKATAKGDIIITTTNTGGTIFLTKIVITRPDRASYSYDPAKETYDLSQQYGNASISSTSAGYSLNNNPAYYINNPGCVLNNRVAINSANGLAWNGGLLFNGDGFSMVSISNLNADDRVKITYSGGSAIFANEGSVANGDVFLDASNDGEQDEIDDVTVHGSDDVESGTWYTMLEDGHLDLVMFNGAKITKIEIVSDHQAEMVDRDNNYNSKTSYFDTTGQLEAKHHIVPGGLHVYVGNDNDTQHAEVVMSDKGPVSFVYDEEHYKMARYGGVYVWGGLPSTGTFYKFVPEVSGKMWVKFKAVSVKYSSYNNGIPGNGVLGNGTPNETTTSASCPYYLMVAPGDNNASFSQVENAHYYVNGADGYFGSPNGNPSDGQNDGIFVEKGKTYYLYGWWQDGTNQGQLTNYSCGVAELLEVTFKADKSIIPLAKWVETKTKNDGNLATVNGYSTVVIKKKSENIASCEPYIENGKLGIRNITFVDENKGGGTILLKIGDPNNDADPVFAYTIAYNAGYNQPEGSERSEGHTWNFSDQPLKGLKWEGNRYSQEATVTDFGTRFNDFANAPKDENTGIPTNGVNGSSLLSEEITKGDWTFNYRVKKNGQFHDPRFLNNWDMEGDNADMMWDTEGLIINAGSSQSCIFNEFQGQVQHTETDDPDRYVGFLPGSELIIPKLKKDDRIYIYMGSGNGSGQTAMKFNITNALDALHNPIDEDDEYWAGGSQWNIPTSDVREYHGCYHFYAATDGDMKIKMSSGSMCKLYKIKIYRGTHEDTNGIQEKTGGYTLLSTKGQGGETKSWSLHYRGKGETLADGTGKYTQENEIIAQTGKITNTTITTNGNDFTYTNNEGDLGTIRVRIKCMEYNHNYVTDFADRNLTLAYHETMSYPYTWDFMDMDVADYSGDNIDAEWTNNKNVSDDIKDNKPYETYTCYNLSMWDADGKMRVNSQVSDPHNYNYIFQNLKGDNGNQLWANNDILPETQGLWFYMDNNDPLYSGCMQIDADGMHLINNASIGGRGWWNYKMVVPSVPAGAAVYLRMARDERVPEFDETEEYDPDTRIANSYSYDLDKATNTWNKNPYKNQKYQFAHMSAKAEIEDGTDCRLFQAEDESGDYIVAIKNTGSTSNLTLTLNGWTLKKMSVSTDVKRIGKSGYATESRARDIDHNLTGYLTGKPVKAYTASLPTSGHAQVLLTQIGAEEDDAKILPAVTTNGAVGGCILYHNGGVQETVDGENVMNRTLSVLDGGFHEFVPDMHDKDNEDLKVNTSGNILKAFKPVKGEETTIYPEQKDQLLAPTEGSNTNMILSTVRYTYNGDGTNKSNGYEAFFIRVDPNKTGAKMWQSTAYIQLPTLDLKTLTGGANGAKMSIVFADDFFIQNSGITTAIDDALQSDGQAENENNAEWYNLNGQKLNSKPTSSGLYIVNGKKVMVK